MFASRRRTTIVFATLGLVIASRVGANLPTDAPVACDAFCHLVDANEASLVMLEARDLIEPSVAARIADAIERHEQAQAAAGSERSGNYVDFERALDDLVGEDASRLHIGRSRQDLHETVRRLQQRDQFFAVFAELAATRGALLDLAERYADAVIPAYTHGVQAQPTSAGQYFLAFAAALERDADRLKELYPRLNRSPLGAAVLGTSGFALDRNQLAELLGFAGPIDNAYDATLLASFDVKLEFAQILAGSATQSTQLIENLHTQYHVPVPWMRLGDGQTSGSSIMPQKRNPRPLDRVRSDANAVIAAAQEQLLAAHNVNTGMHDYRAMQAFERAADAARSMYRRQRTVIESLVIDRARALAELQNDYSTMTEVADVLVREAGLPFRQAHAYAKALSAAGRASGRPPLSLADEDLERIYRETLQRALPVAPARIRAAMDPASMVAARRGRGGPQAVEVQRMLAAARAALRTDLAWSDEQRARIERAQAKRRRSFDALQR